LTLRIAHTLVIEKLHDKIPQNLRQRLRQVAALSDGRRRQEAEVGEWAAAISDVPADVIEDLARRFAKNRTILAAGWSLQRQQYGEQRDWILVTLAAMVGQIGLPGGGFGFTYDYAGGGSPSADGAALGGMSDGGKAKEGQPQLTTSGAASIPLARVVEMLMYPDKEFDFNGKRAKYPDVKLAYWVGGNPLVHHQDRDPMVEAWRKLDSFTVHDFQRTSTSSRRRRRRTSAATSTASAIIRARRSWR
jgi:trimethylamine-N-oxide reductase (cytochrome c)